MRVTASRVREARSPRSQRETASAQTARLAVTRPNAGLEEPALGGPAQEATQRRLFTAASSDVPTDFATALHQARKTLDARPRL